MAQACKNRAGLPQKAMVQLIMAGMHPTEMPADDAAGYRDDSKAASRPRGQVAACRQVSWQKVGRALRGLDGVSVRMIPTGGQDSLKKMKVTGQCKGREGGGGQGTRQSSLGPRRCTEWCTSTPNDMFQSHCLKRQGSLPLSFQAVAQSVPQRAPNP